MIRIYGEGVRVGTAEITDKQIRDLSSGRYGPDDLEAMEDSLPVQWRASGLIEDALIEVDDKILDITLKKPHQFMKYETKPIAKKGKNLFVVYHVMEGAWLQVKTSGKFDAAKLKGNIIEYTFPSGRGFGINEVSYDGWRTEGGLHLMWKAYTVYTAKGILNVNLSSH